MKMTSAELHAAAAQIAASLLRVVPVANAKGGPYQVSASLYFDTLAALEAEAKKRGSV